MEDEIAAVSTAMLMRKYQYNDERLSHIAAQKMPLNIVQRALEIVDKTSDVSAKILRLL